MDFSNLTRGARGAIQSLLAERASKFQEEELQRRYEAEQALKQAAAEREQARLVIQQDEETRAKRLQQLAEVDKEATLYKPGDAPRAGARERFANTPYAGMIETIDVKAPSIAVTDGLPQKFGGTTDRTDNITSWSDTGLDRDSWKGTVAQRDAAKKEEEAKAAVAAEKARQRQAYTAVREALAKGDYVGASLLLREIGEDVDSSKLVTPETAAQAREANANVASTAAATAHRNRIEEIHVGGAENRTTQAATREAKADAGTDEGRAAVVADRITSLGTQLLTHPGRVHAGVPTSNLGRAFQQEWTDYKGFLKSFAANVSADSLKYYKDMKPLTNDEREFIVAAETGGLSPNMSPQAIERIVKSIMTKTANARVNVTSIVEVK